jgi:exonuclease III
MMNQIDTENILKIGFMNIRGQTGLTSTKQIQIESFIIREKLDILNLQEINIIEDSFSSCNTICSSFNIISNNAANKYGTASIIKSDFSPSNVLFDTKGRAIVLVLSLLPIFTFLLDQTPCPKLRGRNILLLPFPSFFLTDRIQAAFGETSTAS